MSSKWCLSGNIMHYGFALLVMVQGCSGGGISIRVTLRNGVIFQSCITDLVALFYVDGFLRWLVLFVYLRVQSQVGFWSTNLYDFHWYEIVGRCWHAFACSTNECLHHVCISVLLREEPLYWSLHSGDHFSGCFRSTFQHVLGCLCAWRTRNNRIHILLSRFLFIS